MQSRAHVPVFLLAASFWAMPANGDVIEGFRPGYISPLPPVKAAYDKDAYDRCTVRYLKPGLEMLAQQRLLEACRRAATPKKCKDMVEDEDIQACNEDCAKAGIIKRTWGECSVKDSP